MNTKQSLIPSIIFMVSILSVSLILLANIIPQHNTWLTISALIIVFWNAIVTAVLVDKRGHNE
jgi:hypothetical protein